MISVEGLKKSFGPVKVLQGLDLEIGKAEIVAITGSSGAGKTTLLQIMGSLLRPDEGKVSIQGTDLFALSAKELSRFRNLHLGFVFQFHHLLPEFTAIENVCIPGFIAKKPWGKVKEDARVLLEKLKLTDRLNHKPSELSGGEQQRVAVARSLINSPAVVFADEPSGNLDSRNKQELHRLFFDLRDAFGQTFVIVTHDPELASMSDRQIHLQDGRMA